MNSEILEYNRSAADYFRAYGVDVEDPTSFNVEELAKATNLTVQQAFTLCVNLEDTIIMQELAYGTYDSFDVYDPALFNDSYNDIMEQLGLQGEDEEDF